MNYKNNFVKSHFGFKSQPTNDQKCPATKKHTDFHEKCPPHKPADQAEVSHVDCESFDLEVVGNNLNVPVIDANVALAEIEVAANVEAHIKLPTPAKEIKNIRKNVFLTQCKAVPSLRGPGFVSLFITGFVHKNIQYSDGSGFIRDYEVDVPFSCNQTVALVNPIDEVDFSIKNTVYERRELAKNKHGADRCVHSQVNMEFFSEPIKCKLLAASINEVDLLKNFDKCGRFNKITEKMEVVLLIKLLQTQQVALDDNGEVAGLTAKARCQQLRNSIE
ncbi:CsxC family protein [Halalkalibacter alkalisediminis]|uniref:CsxC family protein n=1 Tax=Halalkalibacter alkalisediminis TaxID=935616 RepID=A0ABV6NQN4_9BACI|nr:hypothetical protein [Halalkalibacter alkalisediminis]